MIVSHLHVAATLFLLLLPTIALSQYNGNALPLKSEFSKDQETANVEILAFSVKLLKGSDIAECDLLLVKPCTLDDLKMAKKTVGRRLDSIFGNQYITYKELEFSQISFDKIVSAIDRGRPIILYSYNDLGSQLSIVIGYRRPDSIFVDNSRGKAEISLPKLPYLAGKVFFLDYEKTGVYSWGKYNLQSDPDISFLCRKNSPIGAIYGRGEVGQCYVEGVAQSPSRDEIQFISISNQMYPIWERPGLYSQLAPDPVKTGVVRKIPTEPFSAPICRAEFNYQMFVGEYREKETGMSDDNNARICKIYYQTKFVELSEGIELLYLIPRQDSTALQEYDLRQMFKQENQLFKTGLKEIKPIWGKTPQGEVIMAYPAEKVQSLLNETKLRLLQLTKQQEFDGLRRYVIEDFPSLDKIEKIKLQNVKQSSATGQGPYKRLTQYWISSYQGFSLTDDQPMFIRLEAFETVMDKAYAFFRSIMDDRLFIELKIEGSPELAEIRVVNSMNKEISKAYITAAVKIYRGKYKINVLKKGFKEFNDNNFNLVQADKYTYNCKLSPNGSDEPSVCSF